MTTTTMTVRNTPRNDTNPSLSALVDVVEVSSDVLVVVVEIFQILHVVRVSTAHRWRPVLSALISYIRYMNQEYHWAFFRIGWSKTDGTCWISGQSMHLAWMQWRMTYLGLRVTEWASSWTKRCNFMSLGWSTAKTNRQWIETILHTVWKFQCDHACLQRAETNAK